MFGLAKCEIFVLQNGLLQRIPNNKQPKLYFGISEYLATSERKEHALVLDAEEAFNALEPKPPLSIGDAIDWEAISEYIDTPVKRIPDYRRVRYDPIAEMVTKAENDDAHALSAMLSNFRADVRPEVKNLVIDFLLDKKATTFVLPDRLLPKRGRAVLYYEAATKADYSDLKKAIAAKTPTKFEESYWIKVIDKERDKLAD